MTILDLKNQIVKKSLSNFYIFTGYEIGIINIYLNQMSKVLGLPITREESVSKVYSKCQGGSLFGDSIGFYVIRDDKDFQKQEKVFDTIKSDIGKNVIVLLYDKIDSRLKFGKHFKEDIIVFEKLQPQVLKTYIKKEINLNDKNIENLMEVCGGNYDMCMLEIDKVKHYMQSTKDTSGSMYTEDHCFMYLLNQGVIYQPEETDVFKFTDAFCMRNAKLCTQLEQVLRENGVSPINILGTLYNSLKNVMLIQCCEGGNVGEITGLDNRQIYFSRKYVGKFKIDKLVKGVRFIASVIEDVKGGKIDDIYATRIVISTILY